MFKRLLLRQVDLCRTSKFTLIFYLSLGMWDIFIFPPRPKLSSFLEEKNPHFYIQVCYFDMLSIC